MTSAQLARLPANTQTDLAGTWWGQKQSGGNFYWRCQVPSRHLPGRAIGLRFDDLKMADGEITMPRQRGDAAIWAFPGNATRGILMRAQQEAGFRVLIEVDDNYLISSPPVPRPMTTIGRDTAAAFGVEWKPEIQSDWQIKLDTSMNDKHSTEAHRRLVGFCDGIIVTTETLADAYRKVHDNVHVCRNSVDLDDWEEPEKPNDGVFRIGYAASHSHWFDAADVQRALGFAAHQSGVEVVMYGLDPHWPFPYRHMPWTTDLAEYRRSLQQLDVGLCPLREGIWADAKSDIKLMEYSLSGAAAVVARRPPYSEWVDTDMALTADDPKEFLKHVRWLIRNQDAAAEMAVRAKERIMAERTIQHEIGKWRAAVAS